MNRKNKKVWIFIVIYPITYYCLFNRDFKHGVEGGKFMCMVIWVGIVRVMIVYLDMYVEV